MRARADRSRFAHGSTMLLIDCPYCGMARPEIEFAYGGEAHIARAADPSTLSDEELANFLYFRSNPKGVLAERWRHSFGCRRFFNCLRDTLSDKILTFTRRANLGRIVEPNELSQANEPAVSSRSRRLDRPFAPSRLHLRRPPLSRLFRRHAGVRADRQWRSSGWALVQISPSAGNSQSAGPEEPNALVTVDVGPAA